MPLNEAAAASAANIAAAGGIITAEPPTTELCITDRVSHVGRSTSVILHINVITLTHTNILITSTNFSHVFGYLYSSTALFIPVIHVVEI